MTLTRRGRKARDTVIVLACGVLVVVVWAICLHIGDERRCDWLAQNDPARYPMECQ